MPTISEPWRLNDFLIKGFERVGGKVNQLDVHALRFKKMNYNFLRMPPFKIQTTAYSGSGWGASPTKDSLRSSEAFAHNIFSGVRNVKFEYRMRLGINFNGIYYVYFGRPLKIVTEVMGCSSLPDTTDTDVVIDDGNGVVDIYEVKMFEYLFEMSSKLIFPELFEVDKVFPTVSKRYILDRLELHSYNSTKEVLESFKDFIEEVTEHFKGCRVYQKGIRQLCCQLLGITNEMKKLDTKITEYDILRGKKIRWYCLCFDYNFGCEEHIINLNKYREALEQMSPMIKKYLKNVNLHKQIKYCGYLGASEYIEKNKDFLGKKNYNYVKKRYFSNYSKSSYDRDLTRRLGILLSQRLDK